VEDRGQQGGREPGGKAGLGGRLRAHRGDLGEGGPQRRVLDEAPGDDLPQLAREFVEVGLGLAHVPALAEGRRADGGVGGDLAEREDVGGRHRRAAGGLFGGAEGGRLVVPVRGRGLREAAQPVRLQQRALRGEQDVGGPQGTVHQAGVVDGLQALGEVRDQAQHDPGGQRPAALDGGPQRQAGLVGGGHPVALALLAAADHRDRVRAADPPGGLGGVVEAGGEVGIGGAGPQDGQRERLPAGPVREVGGAGRAGAEPRGQPVARHGRRVVAGERCEDRPLEDRTGVRWPHQSPFLTWQSTPPGTRPDDTRRRHAGPVLFHCRDTRGMQGG
jgi:hypothetical protein